MWNPVFKEKKMLLRRVVDLEMDLSKAYREHEERLKELS